MRWIRKRVKSELADRAGIGMWSMVACMIIVLFMGRLVVRYKSVKMEAVFPIFKVGLIHAYNVLMM